MTLIIIIIIIIMIMMMIIIYITTTIIIITRMLTTVTQYHDAFLDLSSSDSYLNPHDLALKWFQPLLKHLNIHLILIYYNL